MSETHNLQLRIWDNLIMKNKKKMLVL